jgi:phosphoribosyl isomerase A
MSHLLLTIPEVSVSSGTCQIPPAVDQHGGGTTGTPRDAVIAWRHQGATTVMFTDLDAATGNGDNLAAISDAAHHASGRMHIAYKAAVHDAATLSAALGSGASKIVIEVGSADRDWLAGTLHKQQQRAIAGIDVHGENAVDASGNTVAELFDLLSWLESSGTTRYLISEVSGRDHWFHKDRHIVAAVCESVRHPVWARGTVKHDSDIHALAPLAAKGLEATVVGKPLAEGAFTLQEAVTAAEARYDPYIWAPPQP